MPTCNKCGVTRASAEMRRSPRKTRAGETLWLCKDKAPCITRQKEARREERARKKALLRTEKGEGR